MNRKKRVLELRKNRKKSRIIDQPNIAVVGSGYWGKNLVRNFHDLRALKLICDINETAIGFLRKQYRDVDTSHAFNDVLSREDILGLAIATPVETHFPLVREGLLAGKHVYVEKPLALSEKEGEELVHLANEKKRVLMVGHLLQYHPAFVRLQELTKSGKLGRINYICSHRLNLGKIRREENILWSFAPHDISMILSIAGEEPESVIAIGGNYLHNKRADVTTTHLEFSSGLKAHIFVSWLHPFKEQKLVVVGDQKMAVFDDCQPWPDKILLYPHKINWQDNMPVPAKTAVERLNIVQNEPLNLECRHFLECIRNGGEPLTNGEEGLRVLRILKACQRSVERNGEKIYISRRIRERIQAGSLPSYTSRELTRAPLIHNTAVVDDGVSIGTDTKIWHFSHILTGSQIGKRCSIGQNVVIGPYVNIGNNCKIQNNVSVYKGVTLEAGVFCGPSMVFTNVYNPRAEIRKMDKVRPTLIKRGATLGANCTIVCGVTIGRYAFVGAGAVVIVNRPF